MGVGTGDDDGIDDDGTWGDREITCLAFVPVAVTGTLLTCTSGTEERMGVFTEFTEAVAHICDPAIPGCGVTVN